MLVHFGISKYSLRKLKVFVSQILRHYLTKEVYIRRFEELERSKILGILQTEYYSCLSASRMVFREKSIVYID